MKEEGGVSENIYTLLVDAGHAVAELAGHTGVTSGSNRTRGGAVGPISYCIWHTWALLVCMIAAARLPKQEIRLGFDVVQVLMHRLVVR